jgi:predicted MFS family arabinose efflux permease
MNAYILVNAERKIAGQFMATRDVFASAGVVMAMTILPYVVHARAYIVPIVLSMGFLASLFALSRARPDHASVHDEKKIAHQSFYIRRHFIHHVFQAIKKLNPVSSVLLLQQFCSAVFYGIIWFVIPLMIERMAKAGILSFGLVVFDLAVLITGYFLGRLTDTWSKRWLVFWGLLGFSLFALLLGFHFGILFVVFGFLATSGDEMASVSLWAWLDHLDKDHAEDGLVTGVLTLSEDLGWTVGPIIAGCFFVPLGPTWTIAIGAGLIFISWLASSILLSRSKVSRFALLIAHLRHMNHVPHRAPHKH